MRVPKTSSCRKLIAYDCLKVLIVMPLMPAEGACMGKTDTARAGVRAIRYFRLDKVSEGTSAMSEG